MNSKILSKKEILIVALLGIVGTVAWGLHLGQDLGPDMLNYHLYSGYLAFHKERLAMDVFAAGMQGYMNPYAYALVYGLYQVLPPMGVGVVLGALHGLCFISVYAVARMLVADWPKVTSILTAFICALYGVLNPFFMGMVGSSFSDNLTPPLIIVPLALIMSVRFRYPGDASLTKNQIYSLLVLAGTMMGMSVGFKLTNGLYCFALLAIWLVFFRFTMAMVWQSVALFGSVWLGFLIVDGEWMWRLYSQFKSPTYPFFNNIFKSDMFAFIPDLSTPPFYPTAPVSLYEALVYPFQWAVGHPPRTEWNFTDGSYAALTILLAILLLTRLVPAAKRQAIKLWPSQKLNFKLDSSRPAYILQRCWFIAGWCFISYAMWLKRFGALRYLMPVMLLSGVLLLLCLLALIPYRKIALSFWVILMVGLLSIKKDSYFGRVTWDKAWYPITLPEKLANSRDTLYFQSYSASSLVLPFFPPESRFVSIPFFSSVVPSDGLSKQVFEMVAKHKGPIRTLTLIFPMDLNGAAQLKKLGLRRNPNDCVDFMAAGIYFVQSCAVERITPKTPEYNLPVPAVINFDKPQPPWVDSVSGFYSQEPTGIWTQGDTATIYFAGYFPSKFKLRIHTTYLIGENETSPIQFKIGKQVKSVTFGKDVKVVEVPFTLSSRENTLVIKIPKPTSPHALNRHSQDMRDLGILLEKITIQK